MIFVRSLLYFLAMVISVIVFGLTIALLGRFIRGDFSDVVATNWGKFNLWLQRLICGLRYEIQGLENLPLKVKELVSDILVVIFEQKKILTIQIEGNERIEADAIRKVVKTDPGDIYSVKNLSDDLKAIYGMGYFDDVRVEAEDDVDAGPRGMPLASPR